MTEIINSIMNAKRIILINSEIDCNRSDIYDFNFAQKLDDYLVIVLNLMELVWLLI